MKKDLLISVILFVVLICAGCAFIFVVSSKHSDSTITSLYGNMSGIEGKPKIWFCNRVLLVEKEGVNISPKILEAFLNPSFNLSKLGNPINPEPVEYSCRPDVGRCYHKGKVCFEHAIKGEGWKIEWGMKYCDTGKEINTSCFSPIACGVYFTGIGCPHCALTDPHLFYDFVPTHPLVLVEYEIYRDAKENEHVFERYAKEYNTMPGVPQIIFDKKHIIIGDTPIIQELDNTLHDVQGVCKVEWLPKNIFSSDK